MTIGFQRYTLEPLKMYQNLDENVPFHRSKVNETSPLQLYKSLILFLAHLVKNVYSHFKS